MTRPAPSMPASREVHITSLIVQSEPLRVQQTARSIDEMPNADVHRSEDTGKVVVLLETESLGDVTDRVDAIRRMPGVINVTLVYHQIEDAALLDQPVAFPFPTA